MFQVFAKAAPIEPARYSFKDLQAVFPAFKHESFDHAGFDAVMLPFRYSSSDPKGDANEALALDALISNDLDWAPGSHCARHAYFVFKRSRDEIQPLATGYSAETISSLIKQWRATHAVGGKLVRTPAGYTGTLEIYSPGGTIALSKTYDSPRSYFDLLGDMDVDAMSFLDVAPSQELANYLRKSRCGHPESIADLGSAAFMDERSPEEFAVYKKMLNRDPEFSVVRAWYANQKHWLDRDSADYELQLGNALSSRVEPIALQAFAPNECPDRDLGAEYPTWVGYAAALATEDSPPFIYCRLRNDLYGSQSRDQILGRGLAAAAKYPNSGVLLEQLEEEYSQSAKGTADDELAASLCVASLNNRYSPGNGSKEDAVQKLACFAGNLGRQDVSMEFLSHRAPGADDQNLYLLLQTLCSSSRYSEALDLYPLLGPNFNPTRSKWLAAYGAFAAVIAGKPDMLDQILKDQNDVLAAHNMLDVFQAYRDALAGKQIDPQALLQIGSALDFPQMWRLLLVARCDALKGESRYHRFMTECSFNWPTDRLLWIAQDDYQRRDPSQDEAAFYNYLDWLFGFDPWVASALADFHKRSPDPVPQIDPKVLAADLQDGIASGPYRVELGALDWAHVLTPWRIAACIHQQLQNHNASEAATLAKLYIDYAKGTANQTDMSLASQMARRVAEWKPG